MIYNKRYPHKGDICEAHFCNFDCKCCFTADPSPPPPSGGSCFPSVAKVQVKNGKSVAMSELKNGDQVQTGIAFKNNNNFITKMKN